ncbi:DUF3046 domain-containing protein [Nocardia sp. IFM 10818]
MVIPAFSGHAARWRRLAAVRLTEFQELLHTEFGTTRGDALLTDHVLPSMGKTGAQAIESGIDPRDVWRALCAEFDVPRTRW